MEHGVTWLSFLPGYAQLEHYLQAQSHGILFESALSIQHVLSAMLSASVVIIVAFLARRDMDQAGENVVIPDARISLRNLLEVVFSALYGQMKSIIGKDAARYFPVIAALSMFIFFSNIMGLVPGFSPPTDNWNTTFACGGFVFLYYNFHGIRTHGMGHIAHMANPAGEWWGWFLAPLMFPIELVSHCARPFSLGVRLAANMVGDHAVLFAFLGLVPVLIPLPFLALGLMVCLIQTLVFILLSMIYIGMAVEDAHGDEHHDEALAHA